MRQDTNQREEKARFHEFLLKTVLPATAVCLIRPAGPLNGLGRWLQ
jgi:hypothetical protein